MSQNEKRKAKNKKYQCKILKQGETSVVVVLRFTFFAFWLALTSDIMV